MPLKKLNPTTPALAGGVIGSELQSWAATHSNLTMQRLALKQIYERAAVSEPVALVIAAHAGLLREAR